MAALQAAPPWGFRPPSRMPDSGGFDRQNLAGGNGCRGAPGAPAVPMPVAWALQGPPNRAPPRFSVSAKQTLKIATGATAPVAPLPLRRLHSEPTSSWKGVSRWAGGRPSGGRPPAQRETQNYRGDLLTAQRYSDGGTLVGGLRRPPKSE
ncbi:hypothetical protein NDU88_009110 [Pleurodeles waltl]|uniref:Uncharacterized protein n=1 Tax=Pleurodeles waltl TaxID=8319 RepID=A0AAV7QQK8_PLEWA|nr:hypothetical protein NDU88_009110 [Pleurodeles waltl]